MQFNPQDIIPQAERGIYRFVVTKTTFKDGMGSEVNENIDKNGRPYIKPTLSILIPGKDGLTWKARPFLSTHPKMIFKLKHLCEIAGLDFESGNLNPDDLMSAQGWAKFDLDDSGYFDLDVADFIPERKIAELTNDDARMYNNSKVMYEAAEAFGDVPEQTMPTKQTAADDDIFSKPENRAGRADDVFNTPVEADELPASNDSVPI